MPNRNKPPITAIVYDVEDVRSLSVLKNELSASGFGKVLTLTPNARHAAHEAGFATVEPTEYFGDAQQTAIVGRITETRQAIDSAIGSLPLTEAALLRAHFNRLIFSLLRIEETLKGVGSCHIHVNGQWKSMLEADAIPALQQELAGRQQKKWLTGIQVMAPPPIPVLHQGLTRLLAFIVRQLSPRGRVVTGALKEISGILESIAQQGGRIIVVQGASGRWRDYGALLKQFANLLRPNQPIVLRIHGRPDPNFEDLHFDVAKRSKNAVAKTAVGVSDAVFRNMLWGIKDARRNLNALYKTLKPTSYLSSEVSRTSDYLCAECAGTADIPRIVLGRNAQGPTTDPNALDMKQGYLTSRYPPGMVDIAYFWSEFGVAAGKQFLDESVRIGRVVGTIESKDPDQKPTAESPISPMPRKKRILIADTFGSWWTPLWWVVQTSDEYLKGFSLLAAAVAEQNEFELVERTKQKWECKIDIVETLAAQYSNVRVETRARPFSESLAESDVLVAFFSSTIQEAIAVGCPVFLFGGTSRHRYIDARTTPPTQSDRAAVYAYDGTVPLEDMLSAIITAHDDRAHLEKERPGFGAPPLAPNIMDISAALAAARMPPIVEMTSENEAAKLERAG